MSNGSGLLVPDGWEKYNFGSLTSKIVGGGTPSRKVPEYWNGKIPWATVKDLTGTYLTQTEERISEKGLSESSSNLIPAHTVIIATRMALGKATIYNKAVAINQDLKAIFPKKKFDSKYLLHWYQFHADYIESIGSGSTVKGIRLEDLTIIPLLLPPLPEQKKIASILTSVDDVIEKTEAQISKLQDLKEGMMTELLTKGIGHTEFKDSPVGRIPVEWEAVPYGSVVITHMPPITMLDEEHYSPVIVRRRHNGAEIREVKKGKNILVKQQYKAIPGTFLISKRQIFHGSCGIVPDNIGEQAIISKEYLALSTTSVLDIRFLNYFSHTDHFQQSIIKTTYGVDKEKYVFKDKWWLKEFIPLPPLDEQQSICNAIDGVVKLLDQKIKKLAQTKALKKALMNDLLTGKVRVKTTIPN